MKQPHLPFPLRRRFVRTDIVSRAIDDRHLTNRDLAALLGISRNYWYRLLARRQHLTPKMRLALLACPALDGLAEVDLWDTVEVAPKEAA